jgi:protein-S-isoprenylcysteine O-methyltransferase Ste14
MKAELPAPAEYYRLTRARKLRRTAHRWALVASISQWASLFSLLITVIYGVATLDLSGGAWEVMSEFIDWSYTAFVSLLLAGTLFVVRCAVADRSNKLRQLAFTLEAEHQARYGELAAGEGS